MKRRHFAVAALAAVGGAALAARKPRTSGNGGSTDRLIAMQPQASSSTGETHGCLVVSNRTWSGAYTFAGQHVTTKQLRTPAPNPWEVAWVVWNYTDNNHLYYFVLKTNGWEVGKRDPRYYVAGVNDGQKIIATGESITATIGRWYEFRVEVNGADADIYVDGVLVTRFKDTDTGPLLGGRVGLYCEDAAVKFNNITAPLADTFDMEPLQVLVDGSQLTNWTVAYLGYGSGAIAAA